MLFVSVGYPVGICNGNYQIETLRHKEIIDISAEDFFFWRDVHDIDNLSDEQLEKCAELRDKGLLIYAETDKELFHLIQELTAIRQGAGWWDNENQQHCIMFNLKINPNDVACGVNLPTNIMYSIWGHSDGIRSLKILYETLVKNQWLAKSDDPILDFVAGLIMLAHHQLVFFR